MKIDKTKFSINVVCIFTHIMWFYVMGLTTPFQVRTIMKDRTEWINLIR